MSDLSKLYASDREAVALAYLIDDAICRLEMFRERGIRASGVLKKIAEELADGGLEERDRYRYETLLSLANHLRCGSMWTPIVPTNSGGGGTNRGGGGEPTSATDTGCVPTSTGEIMSKMNSRGKEMKTEAGGTITVALGDGVTLRGGLYGHAQCWTKDGVMIYLKEGHNRELPAPWKNFKILCVEAVDGDVVEVYSRKDVYQQPSSAVDEIVKAGQDAFAAKAKELGYVEESRIHDCVTYTKKK